MLPLFVKSSNFASKKEEILHVFMRSLTNPSWCLCKKKKLLQGIRVGCHACEAQRPHMFHVTNLCCPRASLENSSRVTRHIESFNSTSDKEETYTLISN